MFLHDCNNCGAQFGNSTTSPSAGLVMKSGEITVAALCPDCVSGVKKLKLVLERNDVGRLQYDQFSAIEMEKKAFGKPA